MPAGPDPRDRLTEEFVPQVYKGQQPVSGHPNAYLHFDIDLPTALPNPLGANTKTFQQWLSIGLDAEIQQVVLFADKAAEVGLPPGGTGRIEFSIVQRTQRAPDAYVPITETTEFRAFDFTSRIIGRSRNPMRYGDPLYVRLVASAGAGTPFWSSFERLRGVLVVKH